jgi:hypothetical protein
VEFRKVPPEGRDRGEIDEESAKAPQRTPTRREARAAEAMSGQDRMRVEHRLADRFLDTEARDRLKTITDMRIERERKATDPEM